MQRRSRCYRSSFDKCNARFAAGAPAESEICDALGLACMSVKSPASTSDFRALRRRRRSNGDDAVPIPSRHRPLVQSGGGVRPRHDPVFRAQNGHGPDDGRPAIAHDEGGARHRRSAEFGARLHRPLRMSINTPEARHVFVLIAGASPCATLRRLAPLAGPPLEHLRHDCLSSDSRVHRCLPARRRLLARLRAEWNGGHGSQQAPHGP